MAWDEFVTALKAALFHLEDGQSEPEDFHEAMKVLHRFTDWQHRPPFPSEPKAKAGSFQASEPAFQARGV